MKLGALWRLLSGEDVIGCSNEEDGISYRRIPSPVGGPPGILLRATPVSPLLHSTV